MLTRDGVFLPIFELRTRNDKRFNVDVDPETENRPFWYEFQPEELGAWHRPYGVVYQYRWNVDEPWLIGVEDGPYGMASVQDALTLTLGWEDDLDKICTQDFEVKAWRNKVNDVSLSLSIQCRRKSFGRKGKVCQNGAYELYMPFLNKPFWTCRKCANALFQQEYMHRRYYFDELYDGPEKLIHEGPARLHHFGGMRKYPKPQRYELDEHGNRVYLPGFEHTEAADQKLAEKKLKKRKRAND